MNWHKALRDLATILYDDLEFRAMSLPRVGAAVLTLAMVFVVIVWAITDRMFPGYTELASLTGAIWGAYVFKRWKSSPDEGEDDNNDETG